MQAHDRVQLQPFGFFLQNDLRVELIVVNRPTVAIVSKSVSSPFSGRRKIELKVYRAAFDTDECFKAGLLPQAFHSTRRQRCRNSKTTTIAPENVSERDFARLRRAHTYLHSVHGLGGSFRMKPKHCLGSDVWA